MSVEFLELRWRHRTDPGERDTGSTGKSITIALLRGKRSTRRDRGTSGYRMQGVEVNLRNAQRAELVDAKTGENKPQSGTRGTEAVSQGSW